MTHVATFRQSSTYPNQRLVFDNEVFTIEGSGEVDVRHLADFDSKGELGWVSSEMRDWVYQCVDVAAASVAPTAAEMAQLGVEIMNKDPQRAESLFEKAASQGDITALVGLGLLFHHRDPEKAKHFYGQAAVHGNTTAMIGLANLLIKEGDALSMQRAVSFLETAASKGDVNAMVRLSNLYTLNGFDEWSSHFYNPAKAQHYLAMAVSKGYNASPIEHARTVKDEDPLEALWLYEKAASLGDETAVTELNSFAGLLMTTECEGYTWSEDVPYRMSVLYKARLLLGQTDSLIKPKTENITGIQEVVATVRANRDLFCYVLLDKTTNALSCECFRQELDSSRSFACFEKIEQGAVLLVARITPEQYSGVEFDERKMQDILRMNVMMGKM